jgi:hypothetical protein
MMGEGASRGVAQVYYTGQGQDERAPTPQPLLLHGLDSAWSEASNPHRESGTRWRAAADVGQGRYSRGTGSRSAEQTRREPFGRLRWGSLSQAFGGTLQR